jgi:membrane fusion protein (multidrug efflux system)
VYVDLTQSSVDALRLRREMQEGRLQTTGPNSAKISLILEDGTKYPLDGKLQFTDVTVDQSTGSVTLRGLFPNPDKVLLPGMFVRAQVAEGVNDRALLVPQVGVTHNPKGQPVAMVIGDGNKVALRVLVASRTYGPYWIVENGLKPGDRVIVQGIEKAKPDAVVRPVAASLNLPDAGAASVPAGASGAAGASSGAQ